MCSKFFAATKQIEEELLLWERKRWEKKKWNESTKRAKESEKRDLKSRWVRLKREKKGKGLFNTMNLFYSKPYVYEE